MAGPERDPAANISPLAKQIFDRAHLIGEFRLRSGAVSGEYFDKYLFESDPALLREIAREMLSLLPPAGLDAVAGLELGGIPLVTMLSQLSGIPALFVRKKAKEYGTCRLAEGGDISGRRIVVVEDVVTSGGQLLRVLRRATEERRRDRTRSLRDRPTGGRSGVPGCPGA